MTIEDAKTHLCRSPRGRQAGRDLLALFENGGISLDSTSQSAVFILLLEGFKCAHDVMDLLREIPSN